MENAVYLHLLRSGHKVYVGKSGDKEIDFIAEKNGERVYVQVAYQLADEIQPRNTYKGIQQVNLKEFLVNTI